MKTSAAINIQESKKSKTKSFSGIQIIVFMFFLKLFINMMTSSNYGFHRDEFLYIALGKHLDLGYWSVPPSIAYVSCFSRNALGDSIWAFHFIPALMTALVTALAGLMAKEMGGNRFAIFLACLAIIVSPAYLRSGLMLQPVCFNIFYWTLFSYFIIRYINTESSKYLLYLGVAIGLGLLNKYAIIFYLAGIFIALVFTVQRKLFLSTFFYAAIVIALVIFSPNVWWQAQHGFPVFDHIRELQATQLTNVNSIDFLVDQIIMNLPGTFIWIAGLVFIFFTKKGKTYLPLGWIFISVITLLLLTSGKSYYTLGAFPMMLAAGAVYLGQLTENKKIVRPIISVLMLIILIPILPLSLPILSPNRLVEYCNWIANDVGINGPVRWEDGVIHPIPQDYADMFGWEELAEIVGTTYQGLDRKEDCIIYGQNYGQAGSVDHFGKKYDLPPVISFHGSFLYWAPDQLPKNKNTMIYINDELGSDVAELFEDITEVGNIQHPHARERGTKVFLLQNPRSSFPLFYQERVNYMKRAQ